jgi:peptidoglycan/LPS O-acetylase OafA/YrhL
MAHQVKALAFAGLAAVISGVMLIGTSGLTLVVGWALWAIGLGLLLAAIPSAGEERPPRGDGSPPGRRYSVVR